MQIELVETIGTAEKSTHQPPWGSVPTKRVRAGATAHQRKPPTPSPVPHKNQGDEPDAKSKATQRKPSPRNNRTGSQTVQVESSTFERPSDETNGNASQVVEAKASGVKPRSPSKSKRAASHRNEEESSSMKPPHVVDPAIIALRYLHRDREFAIRLLNRQTLAIKAMARSLLGWKPDLEAGERKRVRELAEKLVESLRKHSENATKAGTRAKPTKPIPESGLSEADMETLRWYVAAELQARLSYESRKDTNAEKMAEICERIPGVAAFVSATDGVAFGNVSRVLAESGGVFAADSVAAVWKRLGLAPPECYRMSKKDGGTAILTPKQARSVCWTLGDGLIRQSKEYKAIYDWRKALELPRTKSKMHAHTRAHRYMTKWAIKNLWLCMKGRPMVEWEQELATCEPSRASEASGRKPHVATKW